MSEYTGTVTVGGKQYEYDPDRQVARVICAACGYKNEVELDREGATPGWDSQACNNCGRLISGKGKPSRDEEY
ncbi:hypothetical protein [Pseudodesulfovibrio tunisiensis]|uniref:hypothetical protein n=1 Tax=Pseudodesulfovibrio tunisiensis TaxID=463192 RepID=UPI001FB2FC07|nr:hypothetical protein [Pseudodesulfovibrio tunisiensis]